MGAILLAPIGMPLFAQFAVFHFSIVKTIWGQTRRSQTVGSNRTCFAPHGRTATNSL